MFKASPRALVYVQLFSNLAFIGRLPLFWSGSEPELILTDALQVVTIPVQMQQQGSMRVSMQPTLIPINHLAMGPEQQTVPYELAMLIAEPADNHPLVAMYVKQVSNIQIVKG